MSHNDDNSLVASGSPVESLRKYFKLVYSQLLDEAIEDKLGKYDDKIKVIVDSVNFLDERLCVVEDLLNVSPAGLGEKLIEPVIVAGDDYSEFAGFSWSNDVLEPLDRVIVSDSLMEELLVSVSVPELIYGEDPQHFGAILYGPPGTGKTEILKSFVDVYKKAGAFAKCFSMTEIIHSHVGRSAKNLEMKIQTALAETRVRNKPSLLAFDEAGILVSKADDGTVSKLYQSVLDTLKRFVGNAPDLVVIVSTNKFTDAFEDALVRNGRLTPLEVGYPGRVESKRLFQLFFDKYGVFNLDEGQAYELVDLCKDFTLNGAFIEEFARTYFDVKRLELYKSEGYTVLEALRNNIVVGIDDIRGQITFESVRDSLLGRVNPERGVNQNNLYS